MTCLHLVLPDGVDDPDRPSGGNVYDRRVADGLAAHGWRVIEHAVPGPWPEPDADALTRLAGVLGALGDDELVLVDGLIGSASPTAMVPAGERLRLAMLVHLPLGVASLVARSAEREALLACRTVVATSAWTQAWLGRHYGLEDVRTAPPGVDPAPLAAGSGTGAALLCVGRACVAKGYDVLTAALETLTDLAWTCEWAGPVDDVAPGPITLLGPLSATELAGRYAAADLVVLPSRRETYGMVLTEALARGVPVLASDVGGVREAVGVTPDGRVPALLVPPADPDALAASLRRWLTDPRLRADLRSAARARRARLSGWDDTAARVSEALPRSARRHVGARR
ncbi:glycosyltransferase family 4 protein [Nocardioides sp. AN3]